MEFNFSTILLYLLSVNFVVLGRYLPTGLDYFHPVPRVWYGHYDPPQPPPGEVECAKIWNTDWSINLSLNQGSDELAIYNFIPIGVQMRERSVLIMIDTFGGRTVTHNSIHPGEKCWTHPIAIAYCESCLGKQPIVGNPNSTCAILFESRLCSTALGYAVEVKEGDEDSVMERELSRKVSSIVVRDECQLEAFDEEGFQGRGALITGTVDLLPPEWEDKIASFKCNCGGHSSSTTYPGTTISTELPTIPISTTELSSTPFSTLPTSTSTTTQKPQTSSTTLPTSTSTTQSSTSSSENPVISTSTIIASTEIQDYIY